MQHATPGGAVATRYTPRPDPDRGRTAAAVTALLATALSAMLFACSGDSSTVVGVDNNSPAADATALASAEIRLVSGDAQEGVVASVLPQPLVVEVLDSTGTELVGAPVEWQFVQGRGSPNNSNFASSAVSQVTDANGRATVWWQLGTGAGIQQVSANIVVPDAPQASSEGPLTAPNNNNGKKLGLIAHAKPSAMDTISVTPSTTELVEGDSVQLSAQAMDKYGNTLPDTTFVWSSSNEAVATTSGDGMVHTLAAGSAEVSAESGSIQGTATITVDSTVSDSLPVIARVIATPDTLRFSSLGSTATISVVAESSVGDPVQGVTFDFATSNPTVAQVDAMGRVTSMAVGTAIISVSALCCNAADSVTVQVTDTTTITPPPAGFVFYSDWSTATGSSTAALLDTSKDHPWDAEKGDGNGGAVVTDTVPWPDGITDALTISHISGNDNPGVRLDQSLPNFTYGDKHGYRAYFKDVIPDVNEVTSDRHPWQDAAGGSNTNWEFNVTVSQNGQFAPYFELPNSGCAGCVGVQWTRWTIGGGVQGRDAGTLLPKDSVYRFEFLLTHHPTADSMDIEIKAYNADGSLRVDSDQWRRVSDGSPSSDVVWYSINPTNAPNIRDMQIGVNGWGGGTTSTPYVTWHWAGVAVCNDWCGRYSAGK